MKKTPAVFLLAVLFLAGCASTGRHVQRIDKPDAMYAMMYDYDNNPVQEVQIYVNGTYAGESDVQGRFLFSGTPGTDLSVRLVKPSYEPVSVSIHFDPLKMAYFKMGNAEQFRKLSEDNLSVHEYSKALDFCQRAEHLESRRQDILYLKAVILNQLGRYGESDTVLETMNKTEAYASYINSLKVKNENKQS
jgi:hypothetical protein